MSTTASTPTRVAETRLDPRGPQFSAAVTALLLLVVLVAPTGVATVLVAVQAALFALGALRGVQHTPTAWAFRTWVRPRLAPPSDLEDARPPRFAQAVGLGFALVALVGFLAGAELVGQVATGFALVAALLNALFRFCLGCELYLLLRRLAPRPS
ncbi:DUF4395 domain-containing protein [Nocardioides ochotonae]|uniref:DUF4395 domain-containing protein n=1 Tax=Nocardioides ochotonae TaxID=2685869 RepID=UPI00140A55B7|nr:DUF4395 domain-containing protein [Nocardioides ochotonae]